VPLCTWSPPDFTKTLKYRVLAFSNSQAWRQAGRKDDCEHRIRSMVGKIRRNWSRDGTGDDISYYHWAQQRKQQCNNPNFFPGQIPRVPWRLHENTRLSVVPNKSFSKSRSGAEGNVSVARYLDDNSSSTCRSSAHGESANASVISNKRMLDVEIELVLAPDHVKASPSIPLPVLPPRVPLNSGYIISRMSEFR